MTMTTTTTATTTPTTRRREDEKSAIKSSVFLAKGRQSYRHKQQLVELIIHWQAASLRGQTSLAREV